MIKKHIDLGVGKQFVRLVHSFLANRSQYVNVSAECSSHVSISTGTTQGCILSPFVYTMYTNSRRSAYSNNHHFKCADDTALVGLLSDDETDYRNDIDYFVSKCVANCIELNVFKTKELVIDFRSGVNHPTPVNNNGQHIEIVHSYKHLGTTIDDNLRWDDITMNLYKKGQ